MLLHGDCLAILPTLDAESIDAIVTDPPYGLGFMGRSWDHGVPGVPFWTAMLRVAKPGAHLLAFGGTRTVHRIATAIEDAGWEIRDTLVWAYASGFPKSRNLDGEWQGWGTALKPAWEPIVLARKPLRGTVAANVLAHGTGALNIDRTRIPGAIPVVPQPALNSATGNVYGYQTGEGRNGEVSRAEGRWPANVILTDPIFDGDTPGVVGGGETHVAWTAPSRGVGQEHDRTHGKGLGEPVGASPAIYGDSGTYSRFFLIPKAARRDREPKGHTGEDRLNTHPTVKPTALMRHLVRLVTPPGGVVLDPFLGSGTTALAAEAEGFSWIGIEREAEYVAIAEARLNATQRSLGLAG